MERPGIILKGWSQSSNGVVYNEEMSEHEENCCSLISPSTHESRNGSWIHWLTSTQRDIAMKETIFAAYCRH
ncbi:hypothetical protein TNCT_101731 [Trichonephila clavata]|uniref:Uncharacterized protein n=1 Tax=Trichonephila clavata TaxID=2740835 RepID=A0A8X6M4E0_TRICU|nr:hypothetical protein TNCT_101731 [Trichonephila clavata]